MNEGALKSFFCYALASLSVLCFTLVSLLMGAVFAYFVILSFKLAQRLLKSQGSCFSNYSFLFFVFPIYNNNSFKYLFTLGYFSFLKKNIHYYSFTEKLPKIIQLLMIFL